MFLIGSFRHTRHWIPQERVDPLKCIEMGCVEDMNLASEVLDPERRKVCTAESGHGCEKSGLAL